MRATMILVTSSLLASCGGGGGGQSHAASSTVLVENDSASTSPIVEVWIRDDTGATVVDETLASPIAPGGSRIFDFDLSTATCSVMVFFMSGASDVAFAVEPPETSHFKTP